MLLVIFIGLTAALRWLGGWECPSAASCSQRGRRRLLAAHRRLRARRTCPEAELLAANITERLARPSLSLVTGFAEQLSWKLCQLDRKEYGQDLSGDAFLYTRAAVVAAGRTVFDRVKTFQAFSSAKARSPDARSRAWSRSYCW